MLRMRIEITSPSIGGTTTFMRVVATFEPAAPSGRTVYFVGSQG
jgi:hypothetical protein